MRQSRGGDGGGGVTVYVTLFPRTKCQTPVPMVLEGEVITERFRQNDRLPTLYHRQHPTGLQYVRPLHRGQITAASL